jgi:uncharacterized protein YjbI with pentapeptide repeats
LSGADFSETSLYKANLAETRLIDTNFFRSDLRETRLYKAALDGTNLRFARLIEADLQSAELRGCYVYGVSAWNLRGIPAANSYVIITPHNEPALTVDDLEVAQFIYLLINNQKLRNVIDTMTASVVLILGRFIEARKTVLEALRGELRRRGFTPVIFDFDKPASKDLTGTVELLARMARFIIADLTDPSSIPHELASVVPHLRTTPVLPLRMVGTSGYTMFDDFRRSYSWVLDTYNYKDGQSLISELSNVIAPADEMAERLRRQHSTAGDK